MSKDLETRVNLSGKRPQPPKYSRVRGRLEAEIIAGRLAPGEALPTEADLARNFGVGRNTLRQALAETGTGRVRSPDSRQGGRLSKNEKSQTSSVNAIPWRWS